MDSSAAKAQSNFSPNSSSSLKHSTAELQPALEQQTLDSFLDKYHSLDAAHLDLLRSMYTQNVTFIDPLHTVEGMSALTGYFKKLYSTQTKVRFEFTDTSISANTAWVQWLLHVQHPQLNKSKPYTVEGVSKLEFEGEKVSRHQDFFDLGAMFYLRVPGVKTLVKAVNAVIKGGN